MDFPATERSLLDRIGGALCVVDPDGNIEYMNGRAETLTGWSASEVSGKNLALLLPDSQVSQGLLKSWGSLDGDECFPRCFSAELVPRSGAKLLVVVTMHPYLRNGAVGALITIQGRRERPPSPLDESGFDYLQLIEDSNSIVLVMDVTGKLTFFNKFAESFLGFGAGEVLGRSVGGTILPEEESTGRDLRDLFQHVISSPEQFVSHENENVTKDGRRVWVAWTNKVIRDAKGEPVGVISLGNDITATKEAEAALRRHREDLEKHVAERTMELTRVNEQLQKEIADHKRAEEALYESRRKLATLMSNLPGMAYRCRNDREWTMEFVSEGSAELTGYQPSELIMNARVAYGTLVHPEDREDVWQSVQRAMRARRPFQITYRIITASGEQKWVWEQGQGVYEWGPEPVAIEGMIADVTDRRRTEETQRLATVGKLAAGVAHEFNNILASMMLSAEMALARDASPDANKFAERVLKATTRGAKVCTDLMSFARPRVPERTPMPIEEPIEMALSVANLQIQDVELQVERKYNTEGVQVWAEAGQLEQVFLNLVINACHATPPGGTLTIETEHLPGSAGPGEVVVRVSDTGVGIAPEFLPHIFEPFFTTRGEPAEGGIPGAGLGLSVSHGIITAHDGAIHVRSEVDVGSTFEIRLQAHAVGESESPADATKAAAGAGGEAGSARILLAEDEDDIREFVGEALEARGHSVVAKSTAHEAVRELHERPFDIVITDLLMPGGGASVLAAVCDLPVQPPVIVITGKADDSLPREFGKIRHKRYLKKPFRINDIRREVEGLLSAARTD